jgi:hypothetical protein
VKLPAGYVRITAGQCDAVVRIEHEGDARILLAEGTLYDAAARDLAARAMQGRGVVYAIALPATRTRAVVRRNRHGGLFAPLTRDLFLPPTRAPHELDVALRLLALGVPTPPVLMYGRERVHGAFRRADVVTREILGSSDLASFLGPEVADAERDAAWMATRQLLLTLSQAGVRHHDLNVKNVLLATERGVLTAYTLDVDRVTFGDGNAESVRAGNARRLLRSALKWRETRGSAVGEGEIEMLEELAGGALARRPG